VALRRIIVEVLFRARFVPVSSLFFFFFLFFFLFSFAFPNTVGDNRVIPRARLKGEGTVKRCYTRPHVCVQWKPEDRSESTHAPRAALSLHGLLIPNFADNGRGASFSPFYADTLVERRTNAGAGGFCAPAGT